MRSLVERGVGKLGGLGGALELLLLQSGAPLLVRSQRDAKAALDQQLRAACEAYNQHATNAKPLNSLLAAATPKPPAAAAAASPATPKPPAKLDLPAVAAAVAKAEGGVHGELQRSHALMRAYLPEPQTQEILFAPVLASVLDALGQLETLLHAAGVSDAERAGFETERLTKLSMAVDAMAEDLFLLNS